MGEWRYSRCSFVVCTRLRVAKSATGPGCCLHAEGLPGICVAAVNNDDEKSVSATNCELFHPVAYHYTD
jgi:hypothetical protein